MKKTIAALALCTSTFYANAQKPIFAIGAGAKTCAEYLDVVKSGSELDKELLVTVFDSWIQGYLSGRNVQLDSLKYKSVDLSKAENLGTTAIVLCKRATEQGRGDIPVGVVIGKVFQEAFDSKVKTISK